MDAKPASSSSSKKPDPKVIDAEFVDVKAERNGPKKRDKDDPDRPPEPLMGDAADALESAAEAADLYEPGSGDALREKARNIREAGRHVGDAVESAMSLRDRLEGYARQLDKVRGSPVFKRRIQWGKKPAAEGEG